MKFLPEEVYSFLGHEIGVRSNSREILAYLRSVYSRFRQGCDGTTSRYKKQSNTSRLRVEIIDNLDSSNELIINDSFYHYRLSRYNDYYRGTCQDLQTLAHNYSGSCNPLRLIQTVILRTVILLIKNYHLFHAGAVSWHNKGIIFPANSDMGKTTLVLKLVLNGCKFLSDEIACLNPELNLLEPFPRTLNIRDNSHKLLGLPPWSDIINAPKTDELGYMLDIEDIAPDSLSKSCTPHYIIFLRGFGDKARLENIPRSNALFELLKFSYSPVDDPASLLFMFAPLLDRIECFNVVIGDLNETAELVMQLADQRR